MVSRMSESSWPVIPRIFIMVLVGSDLKLPSKDPTVTAGNFEIAYLSLLFKRIARSIIDFPFSASVRTQLSTSANKSGLGLVVFNR